MTRKHFIEMSIAAAVVVALILVLFLILRDDARTLAPSPTSSVLPERTVSAPQASVAPEQIPAPVQVSAETAARVFAERFGSYSSEADFANIDDVLPLVTERLSVSLRSLATTERAKLKENAEYYGTSTYVLSASTLEQTDTRAVIACMTQRVTSVGSAANSTTMYQTLTLTLQKEGEIWKIDAYSWE